MFCILYPILPTPFIEKTIVSTLLFNYVKDPFPTYVWFHYCLPLIVNFYFYVNITWFWLLWLYRKSWNHIVLVFWFCFQSCFLDIILDPLHFHMSFRITLSKMLAQVFVRIMLNLYLDFRRMAILLLSLLSYKTWKSSLFRFSFISFSKILGFQLQVLHIFCQIDPK